MRASLVVVLLVGSLGVARADVFAFKDLEGFEKCMQLDHLVETVKTDKGSQTRLLGPGEIQPRCIDASVKLVAKNKDLAMDVVKSIKRLSAPVNALDVISVLVDLSLPACNEIEIYEVVMVPLDGTPDTTTFAKSKSIIKRCLKDKDFKKDFLDEKDSQNAHRAANACQILLDEKLVKACKGGK